MLRGIAIMFIVLGHNPLTAACPKIFNIIFSFHIPLFFFISGYLFSPNIAGSYLCRKRFNSLIMPYIFTICVVSLIYILVKGSPSPLWYIFWAFYGNGPNLPKSMLHLWFLPHLFIVTIFVWALFKYIDDLVKSTVLQLLLIIVFLFLGVLGIHLFWSIQVPLSIAGVFMLDGNQFLLNGLIDNPAYIQERLLGEKQFILKGLPWSADIILVTAAFFNSGYFVRRNNLEFVFHKHSVGLLMVAIFAALHYSFNYTIDLNLRRYDNFLISTLSAFTGIFICTYVSHMIVSINNYGTLVMQYIGRYSLVIFIFHPMLQSKVYSIISGLTSHAECIAILSAFAAGIGLPLALNYLLLERFKFFRYWYYAR